MVNTQRTQDVRFNQVPEGKRGWLLGGRADQWMEMRHPFCLWIRATHHPRTKRGRRNLQVARGLRQGIGWLVPGIGFGHVEINLRLSMLPAPRGVLQPKLSHRGSNL